MIAINKTVVQTLVLFCEDHRENVTGSMQSVKRELQDNIAKGNPSATRGRLSDSFNGKRDRTPIFTVIDRKQQESSHSSLKVLRLFFK